MGITDIDDKIIKRANERNEDFQVLTRREEKRFLEDMTAMKVLSEQFGYLPTPLKKKLKGLFSDQTTSQEKLNIVSILSRYC